MIIKTRAFITSKSECRISECQDRFAINSDKGFFAIADGVSQSLLPSIWAKTLVDTFALHGKILIDNEDNSILPEYFSNYNKNYNHEIQKFSDSQRELIDFQKERINYAASTFVGVSISNDNIIIQCIGDSVFFLYKDNHINYLSSMAEEGKLQFDNSPQYLASDNSHNGRIITRSIPICPCTMFLMTDALADWFYKHNNSSEVINTISSLRNNSDFKGLVDSLRRSGDLKDDDTTLLVLDVTDDDTSEIKYETLYCDSITELQFEDYQKENNSLKKELSDTQKELDSLKVLYQKIIQELNHYKNTIQVLEDEKASLISKNRYIMDKLSQIKKIANEETF